MARGPRGSPEGFGPGSLLFLLFPHLKGVFFFVSKRHFSSVFTARLAFPPGFNRGRPEVADLPSPHFRPALAAFRTARAAQAGQEAGLELDVGAFRSFSTFTSLSSCQRRVARAAPQVRPPLVQNCRVSAHRTVLCSAFGFSARCSREAAFCWFSISVFL